MSLLSFLVSTVVFLAGNAQAAEPLSGFEIKLRGSSAASHVSAPYFQVNNRDCKAWVSVDIEDVRGPEVGGEVGHRESRSVRRSGLVPGLAFDCHSREIRWNGITCASVDKATFFSPIPRIRPTGACHLSHTETRTFEDDGFRIVLARNIKVMIRAERD